MSTSLEKYLSGKLLAFGKQYELIKFGTDFYRYQDMKFVFRQDIHDALAGSEWVKGDLNFIGGEGEFLDDEFAVIQPSIDARIFVLVPLEIMADCAELTGEFSAETLDELEDACIGWDRDPSDFRYDPGVEALLKGKPEFSDISPGVIIETNFVEETAGVESTTFLIYLALSNGRLYVSQA